MSSDISVHSTSYQVDNRQWLVGTHGVDVTPGVTLDVSKFTKSTHYPNGFIRSGQPLGKVTASGLYGPYDDTAVDGRQTCAGLLFSYCRAIDREGNTVAKVGSARFIHGLVDSTKLPVAIDAAGKADLPLIVWL